MGYLTNAALLRRRVQELEPDLVHAHYVSGYGTLATLLAPHPLVLSVWGSDIYEFPSTSPLHAWLIRRNLRKADLILSTSQAMAHRTRCFTNQEIRITPFGST